MIRYCLAFLLSVIVSLSVGISLAAAERRVALVVGNNNYPGLSADEQLRNAVNDAREMEISLRLTGFEVRRLENVGRQQFILEFGNILEKLEQGDIFTLFFAGHGVQIAGENYLLPSDLPSGVSEASVGSLAVRLSDLQDAMSATEAKLSIVIIDACRNNPLAGGGRNLGERGLAAVTASRNSFIMFSAGKNEVAQDGLGEARNSVYTAELSKLILEPGRSLSSIAREVRTRVKSKVAAAGLSQFPAYYDDMDEDFFFIAPHSPANDADASGGSPATPPQQPYAAATEQWLLFTYRGVDFYGGDLTPEGVFGSSEDTCQRLCEAEPQCRLYTWNSRNELCFLKRELGVAMPGAGAHSGFYRRTEPGADKVDPAVEIEWKFYFNEEMTGFFLGGQTVVESLPACLDLCKSQDCAGVTMETSKTRTVCKMAKYLALVGELGKRTKKGAITAVPEYSRIAPTGSEIRLRQKLANALQ